jgi:hypothetical protein
MARGVKLATSRRIPVREEKRPVAEEVVSLDSSFDTASDPFEDTTTTAASTTSRSPTSDTTSSTSNADFNMADWFSGYTSSEEYDTAYQESLDKYQREAEEEEDQFIGEFRDYGSGTGAEGYAYDTAAADPFKDKIKSEQPSLYVDTVKEFEIDYPYDYDTSRLYMKTPDTGFGTSAMYSQFGEWNEEENKRTQTGHYVDISGGTAPPGSYSMIWVENPPKDSLFQRALGFAPFRAAAAFLSNGYSEAVIAAGRGLAGETLHFSDWLSIVTGGLELSQQLSNAQTATQAAATADAAVEAAIAAGEITTAAQAESVYNTAYNAARGSTVAGINMADIAEFADSLSPDAFTGSSSEIANAVKEAEDLAAGVGAGTVSNLTSTLGDAVETFDNLSDVVDLSNVLFDEVKFQEEIDEQARIDAEEAQAVLDAQREAEEAKKAAEEEARLRAEEQAAAEAARAAAQAAADQAEEDRIAAERAAQAEADAAAALEQERLAKEAEAER